MMVLKPYVELLTDFLQRKYPGDLALSNELIGVADIGNPWEWFPTITTSEHKRKFHYHMGPTNSGKTKHALEILKKAKTGCYLAPLRLLAMEVHQQLSTKS